MNKDNIGGIVFISICIALLLAIPFFIMFDDLTGFATFETDDQTSFNEGVYSNTLYNTSGFVQLISGTDGNYTSKIFDASGDVSWNSVSWTQGGNYQQDLPDNNQIEDDANMTNNVLLYHLDESSGNIIDYSGYSNTGTNNGASYGANGKINKSLNFAGNGDVVESSSYNYTFKDELTLIAWFKYSGSGTGAPRILEISKDGNADSHCLAPDGDGSLRAWAECGTGSRVATTDDATNYNDGNWHFMVYTYSNPNGILYVDGVQTVTASGACSDLQDGQELVIGAISDVSGSYTHAQHEFDGWIDEIAIFNRTLSATEVLDLYKRGALTLKLQVRSCDDSICNGDAWGNEFTGSPETLSVSDNRYFQFRANFSTTDSNYSPELYNLTIDYTSTGGNCSDGIKNQDETDVDCGGICGATCNDTKICSNSLDCFNGYCESNVCVSCSDGIKNLNETDVDCGGNICNSCNDGLDCSLDSDCSSGNCESSLCVSCSDGIQNQGEDYTDCGGSYCTACAYVPYLYDDCGNSSNDTHRVQGTDFTWTTGINNDSTDAEKSISYHNAKLIYNYTNLSIFRNYLVKVKYLQPTGEGRYQTLKVNGYTLHSSMLVPEYNAQEFNYSVPAAYVKDGFLTLEFEKDSGVNAVCSEIEIWRSTTDSYSNHTWPFDVPANYVYDSSEIEVANSTAYLLGQLIYGENSTYYDYTPIANDLSYSTYNLKTIFNLTKTYEYYNYSIELKRTGSATGMFQVVVNNVSNILNVTDASVIPTAYTLYSLEIPAAWINDTTPEIWTRTKANVVFRMDGTPLNNSYFRSANDSKNNTGWSMDNNDYYHMLEGFDRGTASGSATIETNDLSTSNLAFWINLSSDISINGSSLMNYAVGGNISSYSSSLGGLGANWDIWNLIDDSWTGAAGTDDWASTNPHAPSEFVVVGLNKTIDVYNVSINTWTIGAVNSDVQNFTLSVSLNGLTFTPVLNGTVQLRNSVNNFNLSEPVQARYVMFNFTSNYGATNYVETSEVQIWGLESSVLSYYYSTDSGSSWTIVPEDFSLLDVNTSTGKIRFKVNLTGNSVLDGLNVLYKGSSSITTETCSDGIKNQDETDVDCGGSCSGCADGLNCSINSDCSSNNCVANVCTAIGGGSGGGTSTGGGSGGFGGTTIGDEEEEEEEEEYIIIEIERVSQGVLKEVVFDGVITSLEFITNSFTKDIIFSYKEDSCPENDFENLYKCVELNVENLDDEIIDQGVIKFKVDNDWVDDEIVLYRFHNGSWEELYTEFIEEDDEYMYYSAKTGGFDSYFVITSEVKLVEEIKEEIVSLEEEIRGLAWYVTRPIFWTLLLVFFWIVIFYIAIHDYRTKKMMKKPKNKKIRKKFKRKIT